MGDADGYFAGWGFADGEFVVISSYLYFYLCIEQLLRLILISSYSSIELLFVMLAYGV